MLSAMDLLKYDEQSGSIVVLFPGGPAVPIWTPLQISLFVDSAKGVDTNTGFGWSTALKTITAAVAKAVLVQAMTLPIMPNVVIILRGTFTEAVTVSSSNLAFIGAGPAQGSAVWMESAAGQTLVTLTGKNCAFQNIKFRVPTTDGKAIAMTGADFTLIDNCLFQGRGGSYQAISVVSGDNVIIKNSKFVYLNTATYGAAILFAGVSSNVPSGWDVGGCTFANNLRHIVCTMRQSVIHDNIFQSIGLDAAGTGALTASKSLDLGGAGGQFNTVTRNIMQGTYSIAGGYAPSALSDDWHNNYGPAGLTTVVPA